MLTALAGSFMDSVKDDIHHFVPARLLRQAPKKVPTRPFPRSPGKQGTSRFADRRGWPHVAFAAPSRLAPPFPVTNYYLPSKLIFQQQGLVKKPAKSQKQARVSKAR